LEAIRSDNVSGFRELITASDARLAEGTQAPADENTSKYFCVGCVF
jgi:hypothetical protein